MTSKSNQVERKKKALKRREKALRRQAAIIRRVGDEVHEASQDVEAAFKAAEHRGYLNGLLVAKSAADEARTISDARKTIGGLLEASQ